MVFDFQSAVGYSIPNGEALSKYIANNLNNVASYSTCKGLSINDVQSAVNNVSFANTYDEKCFNKIKEKAKQTGTSGMAMPTPENFSKWATDDYTGSDCKGKTFNYKYQEAYNTGATTTLFSDNPSSRCAKELKTYLCEAQDRTESDGKYVGSMSGDSAKTIAQKANKCKDSDVDMNLVSGILSDKGYKTANEKALCNIQRCYLTPDQGYQKILKDRLDGRNRSQQDSGIAYNEMISIPELNQVCHEKACAKIAVSGDWKAFQLDVDGLGAWRDWKNFARSDTDQDKINAAIGEAINKTREARKSNMEGTDFCRWN